MSRKRTDMTGKPMSRSQQDVITKMKEGWELGRSTMGVYRSSNPRCWLQKGGLGKGGETQHISLATLWALLDRKLIKQIDDFPTIRYILTERGQAA